MATMHIHVLLAAVCMSSVLGSLEMRMFSNSAMAPPASHTTTIDSLEVTVPFDATNGVGSAEITGACKFECAHVQLLEWPCEWEPHSVERQPHI
jgi:hypothetical protein